MQTSVLPATICESIDKRISDFIWGSTLEARRVHLISWYHICRSKELGGLGLQQARELNTTYMMKLAFNFFHCPDQLWVKVLQGKYFRDSTEGLKLRNCASQSALWRGICRA
ncbi:Putative ribonuclease H protein At1g65750 [Linum perenne]